MSLIQYKSSNFVSIWVSKITQIFSLMTLLIVLQAKVDLGFIFLNSKSSSLGYMIIWEFATIQLLAVYNKVLLSIEMGKNTYIKFFLIISDSIRALQIIFASNHNNIDCITSSMMKLIYKCRLQQKVAFILVSSHKGMDMVMRWQISFECR